MKILIAGASGFIGKHLVAQWKEQHEIVALGRSKTKLKQQLPDIQAIDWNDLETQDPHTFDMVVNLAGESINHLRWTQPVKTKILQSRIYATQSLVKWCCSKPNPHLHFLNASALSIYGLYEARSNVLNTENSPITSHEEFLSKVAFIWEQEAKKLINCQIPLTIMRFAVILGRDGGAFPKLALPAKLGLAARLGSGQQPFAWMAIDDLISAIDFIVREKILGPVNMLAPEIPSQDEFCKTLSENFHRPYFLKCPAKLLETCLGQMAKEMLLKGQLAAPSVLQNTGFRFKSDTLDKFLKQ
ncbi:MAG: yfcH [Gammaproteobacteria bacterium]|jgi:uncharacterized protein (TIGR01777 family)|nr:yfcH [Gammaproteobacteria bacterium]